jgi:hypothetical protein
MIYLAARESLLCAGLLAPHETLTDSLFYHRAIEDMRSEPCGSVWRPTTTLAQSLHIGSHLLCTPQLHQLHQHAHGLFHFL